MGDILNSQEFLVPLEPDEVNLVRLELLELSKSILNNSNIEKILGKISNYDIKRNFSFSNDFLKIRNIDNRTKKCSCSTDKEEIFAKLEDARCYAWCVLSVGYSGMDILSTGIQGRQYCTNPILLECVSEAICSCGQEDKFAEVEREYYRHTPDCFSLSPNLEYDGMKLYWLGDRMLKNISEIYIANNEKVTDIPSKLNELNTKMKAWIREI